MVSPMRGTQGMANHQVLQEEINHRVALAQARIEAAVGAIQSGSEWSNYLKLQSSLHRYSANNVWLIASQHAAAFELGLVDTPWPTYVAGFNSWRALGRSVAKGQHGYQILAPNRRAARVATDPGGHIRSLGADEAPSADESLEPDESSRDSEWSTSSPLSKRRACLSPNLLRRNFSTAKRQMACGTTSSVRSHTTGMPCGWSRQPMPLAGPMVAPLGTRAWWRFALTWTTRPERSR